MSQVPESSGAPSPEELEAISRYTRRPLDAGEVYTFPLVLCDNDIDRDGEKFSVQSLDALSRLFLGKTGIFDHIPRGANQTARIFQTAVTRDPARQTADGEEYHALTARAYMVRSERNRDLILDIDAGIKKEVSVGCATTRAVCSICGRDARTERCGHSKGTVYQGETCFHKLEEPTDAYEWSFVAVPSQPAAGVTKAVGYGYFGPEETLDGMIARLLEQPEGAYLTPDDARGLAKAAALLTQRARDGDANRESLTRDVLRAATLSGYAEERKAIQSMAEKLNADELRTLKKAFSTGLPAQLPAVQLSGAATRAAAPENGDFRI